MGVMLQENQRYVAARAVDRWIVGVDLGQSTDPTAICALHHRVVPLDNWKPKGGGVWRQAATHHFDVRHLERLSLGTSYPAQVQHVVNLMGRPPLNAGATLVIDETGVGRPVGDLMDDARLKPTRVTITAGLETTQHGARTFHVPKGVLISGLDARLHTGELRIAAALSDAGALADELKDFQRSVSAAGRATYAARTGAHDDLVLSVAIALWWATYGATSSVEPLRI
ncbi:hypothetical protein [Bauldia litoralis]|uniref:hypothetical protein n=1 Tax=Bauldia litoralis TaxID=665467 RepID=UPI003265CC4E